MLAGMTPGRPVKPEPLGGARLDCERLFVKEALVPLLVEVETDLIRP
jgi:hypothetical protein